MCALIVTPPSTYTPRYLRSVNDSSKNVVRGGGSPGGGKVLLKLVGGNVLGGGVRGEMSRGEMSVTGDAIPTVTFTGELHECVFFSKGMPLPFLGSVILSWLRRCARLLSRITPCVDDV